MNNPFNADGFKAFIQVNSHWLSNYKIHVAGMICKNEEIVQLQSTHKYIHLLGYAEDISRTYRTARAAISPVEGTGLKMKVIEALCHGKPVFGSDHTRDGLPGEYESCIFPIDRAKIESLLTNSKNRRKAEAAAFRYARQWISSAKQVNLRPRWLPIFRLAPHNDISASSE